jgi:hypothetical protein
MARDRIIYQSESVKVDGVTVLVYKAALTVLMLPAKMFSNLETWAR